MVFAHVQRVVAHKCYDFRLQVGFEAQMQIDEQFAQGGAASSLSNYDQTQACVPAFKTLKTLIQGYVAWFGQVKAHAQATYMIRFLPEPRRGASYS
jgi:hypothetical protein